jgi:uracil DNA glycosylase
MDVKISESWKTVLKDEFEKEYFQNLAGFVKENILVFLKEMKYLQLLIIALLRM